MMSENQKMINTATGASPPWCLTHDRACSPIHFESTTQSTSDDDFENSKAVRSKEKRNEKE